MLPVLQAIGAGLSALSALKNLTSSTDTKLTPVAPTAQGVAQSQAAANGAKANDASKSLMPEGNELQDRFLKLLVTQMRNQDPLNPLDNAQVTTQLAQISTVGGIDKLNNTMQSLSGSMVSSQSLQSASLIGRDVYAAGSYVSLANGKATGAVNLTQEADQVFVQIADGNGALVRTLQLGAAKPGISSFEWDGKTDSGGTAPAGTYVFQVTAAQGKTSVPAESLMAGKVGGISFNNGLRLNLEGGGDISMTDVKRIL